MGSLLGFLMVTAPLLPSVILFRQIEDSTTRNEILASAGLGLLGYMATLFVLPTFTPFLARRGLTGKDLCKKGTPSAEKPM